MTIGKICTRDTVSATKDDTVMDVVTLMRREHVGDFVIVKESGGENVPIGIVTDRDPVVEILAQGLSPAAVTVGDIMSDEVVTVREDQGMGYFARNADQRGTASARRQSARRPGGDRHPG